VDFDQDTDQGRRNRTIAFSVLGLVAVGVVIGLLVGGLGLAAVRTADLAGDDPEPSRAAQTSDADDEDGGEDVTDEPPEPQSTADDEETRTPRRDRRPVLRTSSTSVSSSDQVDLTGRFPRLDGGVSVQVQRREGGSWVDFPVTALTQEDGSFSTYVTGLRTGTNVFRMLASSGETTGSVKVQVS
jgi:hypothetical protein